MYTFCEYFVKKGIVNIPVPNVFLPKISDFDLIPQMQK